MIALDHFHEPSMRRFLLTVFLGLSFNRIVNAQDQSNSELPARVGPTVRAPVPFNSVEPRPPDEARTRRLNGICLVSLIVDAKGIPIHPQIVRCTDPIFAKNSIMAVMTYRFKPAMRIADRAPVPVMIKIEVGFRMSEPFDEAELWAPLRIRYGFSSPPGMTSVGADADGIYPLSKQLDAPRMVSFISSGFGDAAAQFNDDLECNIVLTIDTKGKATHADIRDCNQEKIREPAINSLMRSKYSPARLNQKAVPVRLLVHLMYEGKAKFNASGEAGSDPLTSKP